MEPASDSDPRRRTKHLDRAIGIAIGVLLGIAIVVIFVFFGSGDTIDAPSVDDGPPTERRDRDSGQR